MWNSTHARLSTVPCTVRKPLHRTSRRSDQRKELWRTTSARSTVTYMLCTCTATSVSMVIYAHMTHLNEPLCGGSPLGFIRERSQCHGVVFDGDSQNEYHKIVRHIANISGLHLLCIQGEGLSDY